MMFTPKCEFGEHRNCFASVRILWNPSRLPDGSEHNGHVDLCLLGYDILNDRLAEIGQSILANSKRVILWNASRRQWGKSYAEVS